MLGLKLGMLLVLAVISTTLTCGAYAESIFVTFDKTEYQTGDSLTVTGQISNVGMPVIAMSIYDPDGKILSANSIEVDLDGLFSKTLFLDSPFYEKSGDYKIKFDYGQISQNEFFTISNSDTIQVVPESVVPEIMIMSTDKALYTDGDIITISGTVSTFDSPSVLIGIYDTFGSPAGFYFGNVDSDLNFSANFLAVAGVNFKTDGTYSITAHYSESSKSITFDFLKEIKEPIIAEEPIDDSPVVDEPVTTNQNDSKVDSSQTITEKPDTNQTPNETESNDELSNTSLVDSPKENQVENTAIIQNTPQTNKEKKSTSEQPTILKSDPQKNKPTKKSDEQNKNENNLTVEDIALGIMLNQINLSCDHSQYADTITYYDGMGPALYRLCKFDESLNFFNESLLKEPDNVEILSNKGSTLGKLGFYSQAIEFYDQALKIDPDFLPALNNKANALANMGYLQEAKLLYLSAIEKNENYLTAKTNLSKVSEKLPQTHQVIAETFDKVETKNNSEQEQVPDLKPTPKIELEQEKTNFFEELTLAFSSIGSLFGLK